jgi:hypothetical protein
MPKKVLICILALLRRRIDFGHICLVNGLKCMRRSSKLHSGSILPQGKSIIDGIMIGVYPQFSTACPGLAEHGLRTDSSLHSNDQIGGAERGNV